MGGEQNREKYAELAFFCEKKEPVGMISEKKGPDGGRSGVLSRRGV